MVAVVGQFEDILKTLVHSSTASKLIWCCEDSGELLTLIATRVQPLKVFYVMFEELYLDIMDGRGVSVILFCFSVLLVIFE